MSSCVVVPHRSIPHRSITVLAIDSPVQYLAPLVQALQAQGYNLRFHTFLKAGIDLIQELMPDLILINLRVVGAAGYQVCQSIRQMPEIQDTPVVFVGSYISKAQAILAFRSGASEYLTWPLRLEESVLRLVKQVQLGLLIRQLKADNARLSALVQEHDQILQEQESHRMSLAQRNQELQRLAYMDGLTQVTNRLGFNQHLGDLWSILGGSRQSLALILCDVDYFKRYNDHYGHPAGDQCLQVVAQVLAKAARRPTDLVARYGGEEFAILLPASTAQSAAQIAQDIQAALVMKQLPHATSSVSPFISLSVGVASMIPTSLESPETLIKLADEALYEAKSQGRNRVVVANSSCMPALEASGYCVSRASVNNSDYASGLSLEAKCY